MKFGPSRNAFTLVEILIVVVIVGILAAIAIPAMNKNAAQSRMQICVNNMRQIEHATDQAAEELDLTTGQTPSPTTVNSYIKGGAPSCPVTTGNYTYPAVGGNASCSIHATIANPQTEAL